MPAEISIMTMKSIRFYNYQNTLSAILIISGIVCFALGQFVVSEHEYPKFSKYFMISGNFLLLLYFLPMLIGKYNVNYNKVGMTIRINSWFGKSFNFKDVLAISLKKNKLIIKKYNLKNLEFDLTNVVPSDINRLTSILLKYSKVQLNTSQL